MLSPSCLVSFHDWQDAKDHSSGGGSSAGATTASQGGSSISQSAGASGLGASVGGATFPGSESAGNAAASGATSTSVTATGGLTAMASGGNAVGTVATGGIGTGGIGTGGIGTGGIGTGGIGTGGIGTGGIGTGGIGTGGIGTGGTSATLAGEEIKWLTLDGARANAIDEPNGSVGIDGQVRVDSDSCASVILDPTTRCVSGMLCAYSYATQYWGVALLFDFRSIGGQRSRWDPGSYDALGVAYRIRGDTIPRLQLWVLDMDTTTWPSGCSGSPCEIVGPPYGDDRIGAAGTLYFDAMMQDDWDGTGISYEHQPENTLSLQFKIPAVIVGSTAFEFCLDQLGIVVRTP